MRRTLRMFLPLVLAAILAVGSTAYADPGADGSGEDSGGTEQPPKRTSVYYWDRFSRYFRTSDMPSGIRVMLGLGGEDDAGGADAATDTVYMSEETPADETSLALNEEALAAAAETLNGLVIGLDPGHQLLPDFGLEPLAPGSDLTKIRQSAGCFGIRSGVPEYRINLLVAQKVRALLESCGATVVMTRTSSDVSLSNIDRANIMSGSGAALWVRIHCNWCCDGEINTPCVLIPSARVTPDIYEFSRYLGECLGRGFGTAVGAETVELVSLENQVGFNWSQIPVVTLEMGYLSNARDDALLNSDAYQTLCAVGIFNGLVSYFQGVATAEGASMPGTQEEPVKGVESTPEEPEESPASASNHGGEQ
ncbi:MAG TPA: N-acetylmuramoyl-L-alanine amidase [Clostridia bacterium]|nr:N-acetylmuramoyl-L-alanine amidase [Clostridia bacterium]